MSTLLRLLLKDWREYAIQVAAILFAVAVQVQLTLFKTDDYLGLRINVADFLLPLAGIAILVSLLLKKSRWPDWPGHKRINCPSEKWISGKARSGSSQFCFRP